MEVPVGGAVVAVMAPVVALAAGAEVEVVASPAAVALAPGAVEAPASGAAEAPVPVSGAVVCVASVDVDVESVDFVQAVNASATQSATAA